MHPPGKRSICINKLQNLEAIPNRYARAGAAAGPYAEVCAPSIQNETKDYAKRDAGWNEERACREPVPSVIGGC